MAAQVPIDVRQLDSDRFKTLRLDAAHMSKSPGTPLGDGDHESYEVMGMQHAYLSSVIAFQNRFYLTFCSVCKGCII